MVNLQDRLQGIFPVHFRSGNILLINADCMEGMKYIKDKEIELSCVDPPYGIGASHPTYLSDDHTVKQSNGSVLAIKRNDYTLKDWDDVSPPDIYFMELQRVSKHQIIWGVNYYKFYLGVGRLVWDKLNDYSDQYDCEIAYNSLDDRTDIVRYMWAGMMQGAECSKSAKKALLQQGNKVLNESRIHPTQKPVKLYEWLLANYAKTGDMILDTHGGSFSSAIAAYNLGFAFIGFEFDVEYYEKSVKRFEEHIKQGKLFSPINSPFTKPQLPPLDNSFPF